MSTGWGERGDSLGNVVIPLFYDDFHGKDIIYRQQSAHNSSLVSRFILESCGTGGRPWDGNVIATAHGHGWRNVKKVYQMDTTYYWIRDIGHDIVHSALTNNDGVRRGMSLTSCVSLKWFLTSVMFISIKKKKSGNKLFLPAGSFLSTCLPSLKITRRTVLQTCRMRKLAHKLREE